MPASSIIVSHNSGNPASGAKVVLSFDHGGVTQAGRTNSRGEATIQHSATGDAKVIINGSTKGKMRCPGRASFSV